MSKIVCVVRGGTSQESEKSAIYGKKILNILFDLEIKSHDLYLHPNGIWTLDNSPINLQILFEDFKTKNNSENFFIWNCLVGVDGEMGIIEELCEKNNIKNPGHNFISTKLASDKKNFLKFAKTHNFKTPYSQLVQSPNKKEILKVFGTVGIPAIVKPLNNSGVKNVQVVNNFTELETAILKLLENGEKVLIEKLIKGVPVSVFVLEHDNLFHTNIHVYDNVEIPKTDLINLRNETLYLHEVLSPVHHTEYDFILTSKGNYIIEANTHPSLAHGYINDFFRDNIVSLKDYVEKKVRPHQASTY